MMAQPLMSLGWFVFALDTAPFETLKRTTSARWESKNRVGAGPAHQHLGPGADTLSIDGTLLPELTGGAVNLDKLREMQAGGKAWILTSGTGENMGKWFIETVDETRSHFAGPGLPRRIGFSLNLVRYWDDASDKLGHLPDSLP